MDTRTGYTDGMTERQPEGGAIVRAVAYVRVSSKEQRRHGYSLDDQERELRIQIGLRDWDLVEVVRDEGLSGADPSRAGLRRIEELAREGKVDIALATKRNRWFRDIEHRRRYERGLRKMGARIAALNDSGNAIADGVDDLLGEEQRREIARETRRGRRARARKGEIVAGIAPFGFRFTPDRKNFEVEEQEAAIVRKIFALVASGTGLNGVKSALQDDGVPTPRGFRGAKGTGDGTTWSRLVLKQIILSDCYRSHSLAQLAALVDAGNLEETVARSAPDPSGVWWFARRGVEKVYDEEEGGRREFWDNPEEEHIAVPIPDLGVPREHLDGARRRVLANRAPSKAGRRFWELSGGVLHCPCGRRMGTHTAKRKVGHEFYYVCVLRRSNQGRCEHGVRFHRARETEEKVRALVLGFLSRPEEVRRRAEEHVEAEWNRIEGAGRDLAGREGRISKLQERRGALIDLAADGAITREDLRGRLSALVAESERLEWELDAIGRSEEEAGMLRELPDLAESLARDLSYLIDKVLPVRDYETVPEEKTEENPLGMYHLTPDRIRHLSEEEVERRRRTEDERAARYRAMYDDLGLSVVAYPDGTLEANWRFGAAVLRNGSDKSKNRHATRHFHATEHPLVRSFQPGEDWIWCYAGEVVMEPAN
jgi:site-specific DNA recombinase